MSFTERLKKVVKKTGSSLCVGLDPDHEKLPSKFANSEFPYFDFNKEIIEATKSLVCAYKPQFAHYAAFGRENELMMTIDYIKQVAPEVVVILDSKRGDIGNTANYYAKEAFERYKADSVTINPYMGHDSVNPFIKDPAKGAFVLCRTSNVSSPDFQNIISKESGQTLYMEVAQKVFNEWNTNGNCGLVVGATYPKELAEIRKLVGEKVPFLVPGIGAQGGSISDVISASYSGPGSLIISSSRAIIHNNSSDDFAKAAKMEASRLKCEINDNISSIFN